MPKALTLVGDNNVGKTSLLLAYKKKYRNAEHIPTVYESLYFEKRTNNKEYAMFELANIAGSGQEGQRNYDLFKKLIYPVTEVFLVCFSLTDRESFLHIETKWIKEIRRAKPDAQIILIGTKSDLVEFSDEHVTRDEALEMQRKIGAVAYEECSSNTIKDVVVIIDKATFLSLYHEIPHI